MSGSASDGQVPPGYSPPLAVVTHNDHGANIIITAAVGLSLILLFAGIRLVMRWGDRVGSGLDDITLVAATVAAIIQSSIIFGACGDGLGKSIQLVSLEQQAQVQKMYYTSNIFWFLGIGLSKLSVVMLLLRLTQSSQHRRVFYGVAVFVGLWTVAGIFTLALQCDLAHPWMTVGQHCPGSFLRWQVISAFDIFTEVAFVAMTVFLVWNLQTSLSKKAIVVTAFAFRLPMIIAIACRLVSFNESGYTTNPFFKEEIFIIWTQTELTYSIVSATIPTLRAVMNSLNTSFGNFGPHTQSGYGYASGSETYRMSKMKSGRKSSSKNDDFDPQKSAISQLDGRNNEYTYRVWAPGTDMDAINTRTARQNNVSGSGGEDATSVDSNDSRRLIIQKNTTFQVSYEQVE